MEYALSLVTTISDFPNSLKGQSGLTKQRLYRTEVSLSCQFNHQSSVEHQKGSQSLPFATLTLSHSFWDDDDSTQAYSTG